MRKNNIYIKWGNRTALSLRIEPAELEIRAENTRIILRQREIVVESPVSRYEDMVAGKRRYFYIYLSENIKPLQPPRIDIIDYDVVGGFEIRITNIEVSRYLTIITPGAYLYNYVILSDDLLGGETNTRRELFYEKTNKGLTIYFV